MEKNTGIDLIAKERERQQDVEGYDVFDDLNSYNNGEIIGASACYTVNALNKLYFQNHPSSKENLAELKLWDGEDAWPWLPDQDKRKKHGVIRSLVIAGALIAAELDRLNSKEG